MPDNRCSILRDVSRSQRRSSVKVLWRLVGLAFLVVTMAALTGLHWRKPESTAAMRGERIAWSMGCFGCHGPGGIDGIADPRSPGGTVPGWDGGTVATFVKNEQELREWILYGGPRQQSMAGADTMSENLIPMPAYEGHLSDQELDDLVLVNLCSGCRRVFPPDFPFDFPVDG